MAGSKNFAEMAKQLIDDSGSGAKEREQRWHARQAMIRQQQEQKKLQKQQESAAMTLNDVVSSGMEASRVAGGDKKAKRTSMVLMEMACACDVHCNYSVVLANLSRVLWMAYEEYELLHACYTDLFMEKERHSLLKRVTAYWRTFVFNPSPRKQHEHVELLLQRCEEERDVHLQEKAQLPVDPVAPLKRSLVSRMLNPFGCVRCRCLHCAYLDSVMDHRVALFKLLSEYQSLYEDYAQLVWSTAANVNEDEQEVTLTITEMDDKMLTLMLSELHTSMSFGGEKINVMSSLDYLRSLIYR